MITVHLTNGFGNNLFQYVAGRLLAIHHNQELVLAPPNLNYYGIENLKCLGINIFNGKFKKGMSVNDSNYKKFYEEQFKDRHLELTGYFEDYTIYIYKLKLIKSWFPKVNPRSDKDLVIHIRMGDRLFYGNNFHFNPSVKQYLDAIKQFDFDQLHIVSDMPKWEHLTKEELSLMKFHVDLPISNSVDLQFSVDYFNSFIDGLGKYNPNFVKRSVVDDFNFIRSFNNILFQHSTLGWWASVLSSAEKVGVYGPWRPFKGKNNKNLSQINLNGWFQWK